MVDRAGDYSTFICWYWNFAATNSSESMIYHSFNLFSSYSHFLSFNLLQFNWTDEVNIFKHYLMYWNFQSLATGILKIEMPGQKTKKLKKCERKATNFNEDILWNSVKLPRLPRSSCLRTKINNYLAVQEARRANRICPNADEIFSFLCRIDFIAISFSWERCRCLWKLELIMIKRREESYIFPFLYAHFLNLLDVNIYLVDLRLSLFIMFKMQPLCS